jgi:hypothetical protein
VIQKRRTWLGPAYFGRAGHILFFRATIEYIVVAIVILLI